MDWLVQAFLLQPGQRGGGGQESRLCVHRLPQSQQVRRLVAVVVDLWAKQCILCSLLKVAGQHGLCTAWVHRTLQA